MLTPAFILSGCFHRPIPIDNGKTPPPVEGTCRPTGCSKQVCADKEVATTCEYRPEYSCYKKTACERQPDGRCGWTKTAEFEACMSQVLKDEFTDPDVAAKANLIRVASPKLNGIVKSPLTISGEARGNWYFEATFPLQILDAKGRLLAQGFATAQGEWMTTEFVPFTAELKFTKPSTKTGTLVLQKDNPSGLPENDDELRFPVRFE